MLMSSDIYFIQFFVCFLFLVAPKQVRSHAQKYFAKLQKDQQDEWMNQHASSVAGMIPSQQEQQPLSDSVRREAARILAHPETVEAEVRSTLQQLRERYVQLQQRLEERSSIASAVSADDELIALHVLQGGLKQQQPPSPNDQSSVTSHHSI